MRTSAERQAAHAFCWLAAGSERQQNFTFGCALSDGVIEGIGEPHAVIGTDRYGVRVGKRFLIAPGTKELAFLVQHDDGVLAAIKQIDVAPGVHAYTGDVEGPIDAGGV
jgi:hypothetical protein